LPLLPGFPPSCWRYRAPASQHRFTVLRGNFDLVVADDLVAFAFTLFGYPGERRQAFCIERVVGVEVLDIGLIEPCQRDRFQFQTVGLQIVRDGRLYGFDEFGTLLLKIAQRHGGCNRAQTVDKFRFDQ